jgi:hypothetical protein
MANFQQVQSLQIKSRADNLNESNANCSGDCKFVLQLSIAGAQELLCIICASSQQADQIAELIDSYCCLVQRIPHSIWTRTGVN